MKLYALLLTAALPLAAQTRLIFEAQNTAVSFKLYTALHTVHGTFAFKSGEVVFDAATGKASGELIVDAASGKSGSDSRDGRMHKSILESPKFATITFVPYQVEGTVAKQGSSKVQVHGTMNLHGAAHELTIPVEVQMNGDKATTNSHFLVPYVKWGLKNPSMLMLKVNENVEIDIRGAAKITTASK